MSILQKLKKQTTLEKMRKIADIKRLKQILKGDVLNRSRIVSSVRDLTGNLIIYAIDEKFVELIEQADFEQANKF
jgi:hypothetical protein